LHKKDEIKIFLNGIEILNKSNSLLKTLRNFKEDSCIVSCIIRLYRKFIQIFTSETLKFIEYKKEKLDTKVFSKIIKVKNK
jgi:hypothetical protein